jgi:hypothetical protein
MAGVEMGVLWSTVGRLDVGKGREGAGKVGVEVEAGGSGIGPWRKNALGMTGGI